MQWLDWQSKAAQGCAEVHSAGSGFTRRKHILGEQRTNSFHSDTSGKPLYSISFDYTLRDISELKQMSIRLAPATAWDSPWPELPARLPTSFVMMTHGSTFWENQIGVLACKTGTSTCWSKFALVFWTAVMLELQNRPASWVIEQWLRGPSMRGWCQACHQMSAGASRQLGWSAKVCPERHLFHRLVVSSSAAFTSDLPLPFSTHGSTFWENQVGATLASFSGLLSPWNSKICLHLERLSSVYVDTLCQADVKPAIKHPPKY